MAKDYGLIAQQILNFVGGEENITHLEHCSTRLRFSLTDSEKVKKDKLKEINGVMGVVSSGNQCQVVIGNDVIEVYSALLKVGNFKQGKSEGKGATKQPWSAMALDFMVGVFQPLIPAIAGAGILKAILSVLVLAGVLKNTDTSYRVLLYAADAALYFLPLMVAITLSTKINCNKLVSLAAVGALLLPTMTTMLSENVSLFGVTIQPISYSYQVFPAILSVGFLYFVEKLITKISSKPIRVFFVPMVCLVIVVPVTLLILGPLGYTLGKGMTAFILFVYAKLGWIAVGLLAAVLPFMIATGMHKALVPYAISSISEMGEELLYMPASLAHNISEGGACFAVALKTRNTELRATSISAGISAIFGITEPALYGVTLQHKKAMYGVVAGSFISGIVIGLTGLKAFVAMGPGLAGMAMFVDVNNGMNIVWGFVGFCVALASSFVITFILYRDEKTPESESPIVEEGDNMIYSPLEGTLVDIKDVNDEVFATKTLGDGMAIIPETGELYAPCDAVVVTVFDSKHAMILKTSKGQEILLHVGIDTVKLEGKYFEPQIQNGQKVKAGQLLLKFDRKAIIKAGYDITSQVVVTNSEKLQFKKATVGTIKVGDLMMGLKEEEELR